MPEGKNQHLVPQCVQRAFSHSSSNKLIGTFFMPRGHFRATVTIKAHGCDDYFYGKDGVEEWLRRIENDAYPKIQAIITTEQLPAWESVEHRLMTFFTILQKGRTRAAAADADEVGTKALKAALRDSAEVYSAGKDAGEMAGFLSTPRMMLHFAERHVPAVLDCR